MLTQKRGKNVAVAGAILHLAVTLVMLTIWLKTASLAAMSCTWFLAGGLGLWLMVEVLFYCRQLERREAMELEELAAGGPARTIFEDGQDAELKPAAARLAFMERWVVPVFTVLWAGYHVAVGVWVLRHLAGKDASPLLHTGLGLVFCGVIAFLTLLFSYYCLGMSRSGPWRLLRATGSYVFVNFLWIAAVAGALLAGYLEYSKLDRILAYVFPIVQLVLSAELLINLVLDLYRPRVPGEEPRPSFDSRLFNLIAQPGRVGHSIAEAMNYQFGFEVSKTWFYRLVSRAFVPLLIFGVAVLLAMSSIVIVHEGEQGVLLHWGRIDEGRGTLKPGIHFKWPWPAQTVQVFRVQRVHEILLGVGHARDPTIVKGREIMLWTEEHGPHEEKDFIVAVAARERAASEQQQAPPVSIIKLVVMVHYVIDDVKKFAFDYVDAEKLLECVAYREMVRYCAAATLDTKIDGRPGEQSRERPEAIMTFGKGRAAERLKDRVQKAVGAGGLDLGVKITYLGIIAAHPPVDAAPAFEMVLQAEQRRYGQVYAAEAEANGILSRVAGRPESALRLAFAIRRLDELEKLQQRRSSPDDFEGALSDFIARGRQDLKTLDEEIRREQLLGQRRTDRPSFRQELHDSYSMHLAVLRQIQDQRLTYDYAAQIRQAQAAADDLFDRAYGEPAALVAQATGIRWKTELSERSRAEAFQRQLQAYTASPRIYQLDRYLGVLDEVLPNVRKYVLTMDRDEVEVWLNMEDKAAGLGDVFAPTAAGKRK